VTRHWSLGQWLLRATVAVGPVVALLATVPAGATPRWWFVVLVAGVSVGFAVFPESAAGTGAFMLVVLWWGLGLRETVHPAVLVAAAGLLASHLAATVAAYGPATLAVEPAVVRRWALRGLLVFPAAVLAWAAAWLVDDRPGQAGVWVAGLAGLLVAVVAANVLYVRRPG